MFSKLPAYRERRSCSVLKPAKDWLRIIPFGPPGECVPAAMISGTRDDTPVKKKEKKEKNNKKKNKRCEQSSACRCWPSAIKQAEDGWSGPLVDHPPNKSAFRYLNSHRRVKWRSGAGKQQKSTVGESCHACVCVCIGGPVLTRLLLMTYLSSLSCKTYLRCNSFMFAFLQGHNLCHFYLLCDDTKHIFPTWAKGTRPADLPGGRYTTRYDKSWRLWGWECRAAVDLAHLIYS